jgi:hypothetical protein
MGNTYNHFSGIAKKNKKLQQDNSMASIQPIGNQN